MKRIHTQLLTCFLFTALNSCSAIDPKSFQKQGTRSISDSTQANDLNELGDNGVTVVAKLPDWATKANGKQSEGAQYSLDAAETPVSQASLSCSKVLSSNKNGTLNYALRVSVSCLEEKGFSPINALKGDSQNRSVINLVDFFNPSAPALSGTADFTCQSIQTSELPKDAQASNTHLGYMLNPSRNYTMNLENYCTQWRISALVEQGDPGSNQWQRAEPAVGLKILEDHLGVAVSAMIRTDESKVDLTQADTLNLPSSMNAESTGWFPEAGLSALKREKPVRIVGHKLNGVSSPADVPGAAYFLAESNVLRFKTNSSNLYEVTNIRFSKPAEKPISTATPPPISTGGSVSATPMAECSTESILANPRAPVVDTRGGFTSKELWKDFFDLKKSTYINTGAYFLANGNGYFLRVTADQNVEFLMSALATATIESVQFMPVQSVCNPNVDASRAVVAFTSEKIQTQRQESLKIQNVSFAPGDYLIKVKTTASAATYQSTSEASALFRLQSPATLHFEDNINTGSDFDFNDFGIRLWPSNNDVLRSTITAAHVSPTPTTLSWQNTVFTPDGFFWFDPASNKLRAYWPVSSDAYLFELKSADINEGKWANMKSMGTLNFVTRYGGSAFRLNSASTGHSGDLTSLTLQYDVHLTGTPYTSGVYYYKGSGITIKTESSWSIVAKPEVGWTNKFANPFWTGTEKQASWDCAEDWWLFEKLFSTVRDSFLTAPAAQTIVCPND